MTNTTNSSNSEHENKKALTSPENQILILSDCSLVEIKKLLARYNLNLKLIEKNKVILGSFWGDTEAGLIGNTVFARNDTPIHSLLHETCHYICMDNERRHTLDTNAGGTYDEENAVCYLQILLANHLKNMSSEKMMKDMDSWGYTFRLGSAKAWFENDAEDALLWLKNKNLLNRDNQPNYQLRQT